ncbi:hypothetical protein D3C74_348850 [compost metagenome]
MFTPAPIAGTSTVRETLSSLAKPAPSLAVSCSDTAAKAFLEDSICLLTSSSVNCDETVFPSRFTYSLEIVTSPALFRAAWLDDRMPCFNCSISAAATPSVLFITAAACCMSVCAKASALSAVSSLFNIYGALSINVLIELTIFCFSAGS